MDCIKQSELIRVSELCLKDLYEVFYKLIFLIGL